MTRFLVHVGYPKTATTTLQEHLFARHPEVDYIGKRIPEHDYRQPGLFPLINALMVDFEGDWEGSGQLRALFDADRAVCARPCLMLSSENFIHPWSQDPSVVAARLASVAPGAEILITIREQKALLLSFYRWHGAFGQYLYMNKYVDETLDLPLSTETWLEYQFRAPSKNLLGYLHFDRVVSAYSRHFGADRVHVLPFELYRDSSVAFIDRLSAIMGIDVAMARGLLHDKAENDRLDPRFARQQGYVPDAAFSPADQARISAFFGAGNRKLAEMTGIDVKACGYSL